MRGEVNWVGCRESTFNLFSPKLQTIMFTVKILWFKKSSRLFFSLLTFKEVIINNRLSYRRVSSGVSWTNGTQREESDGRGHGTTDPEQRRYRRGLTENISLETQFSHYTTVTLSSGRISSLTLKILHY